MFIPRKPVSLACALALCILPAICTCCAPPAEKPKPKRQLLQKVPPDGRLIHYMQGPIDKKRYRTLKKQELQAFRSSLAHEFQVPFRYDHSKYFNLAYRCTPARLRHLKYFLVQFFQQVYPRYFRYQPVYPFRVVFFANSSEFRRHTGSRAYGFYRSSNKTFYTYAYSGHGTVWHEMIHAFVDATISQEPQQWFNEGLASFYEMAFLVNGKVVEGYANWRMPHLKQAIASGTMVHLKDFMLDHWMQQAYGYAAARFMFCYLWVHGKMKPFVHAYLYRLCPRYQGRELGKQAIATMEKLLGKDIETINSEYLAMARATRTDQKLVRLRQQR